MAFAVFVSAVSLGSAATVETIKLANRVFPMNSSSTYSSGSAVAMHGDILVVGDPVAGAAYVFGRNAGGSDKWGQVATLAPDAPPRSGFGTAVACDGATIAVGSPQETAAYVFRGGGSSWAKDDKIEMYYQSSFGGAVAVSGEFVVVGAPFGYTTSGAGTEGGAGAAYLFHPSTPSPYDRVGGKGSGWGPVGRQPDPGNFDPNINLHGGGVTLYNANGNHFGTAVAVNGQFVAVGSPDAEPGSWELNPYLGIVSVFYIKSVQGAYVWEYAYPLGARYRQPGGRFGASLTFQGDNLLVGEPNATPGRAYTFSIQSVPVFGEYGWKQTQRFVATDDSGGNRFGSAVAWEGNTIAIAAPGSFPIGNSSPGAVYVYDNSGSLQKKLLYGGCETDAQFGTSLAISGGLVAVGAPNKPPNTSRGSVWLSEGIADDLKIRWAAPGGGLYSNPANWSPAIVPAACDIVELKDTTALPPLRTIKMRESPIHEPPSYEMAQLIVDSGRWYVDADRNYISAVPQKGGVNVSRSIDVYGEVALVNASIATPEILIRTEGRLSLFNSDLTTEQVMLSPRATLRVDGITANRTIGGTFKTTNLTIKSECRLGWRNCTIQVESDLIFNESQVLNIEINPSDASSPPVPLFKVAPGHQFKAGGRLNFIRTGQEDLAAGQRFRLVEFTTDKKDVDEIYQLYRFKNYDPTIPGREDLVWGLVFWNNGDSTSSYLDVVVMKKPVRSVIGTYLTPSANRTGLVLATKGDLRALGDYDIASAIRGFAIDNAGPGNSRWDFVNLEWSEFYNGDDAASAQIAIGLGESVAHWLLHAGFHYDDMHLISRNAGAWMVNRMMELMTSSAAIHLTFLNASGTASQQMDGGRFVSTLGLKADENDFVDHYFARAFVFLGAAVGDFELPNLVNFDLTDASLSGGSHIPNVNDAVQDCHDPLTGLDNKCLAGRATAAWLESQWWPDEWYLETVRHSAGEVPLFNGFYCGGFLLSPEFLEAKQNHPAFQFVNSYKASLRDRIPDAIVNISSTGCEGLLPFQTVPDPYPGQFRTVAYAPVGTYTLMPDGGVSMLTDASVAAGPLLAGNGGLSVQEGPPPVGSQWAAITNSVILSHATREFSFNYQFSGSSTGILSVIVDGRLVGVIDQSLAGTNLMASGRVRIIPELPAGLHKFVFVLVSSSAQQSGADLSNLQFGYDLRSIIVAEKSGIL